MKKILLPALFAVFIISPVFADTKAITSRDEPLQNIVLNQSNSYEIKKGFDGTPSEPDSVSYLWTWVENSVSKTGPKVNFTFDRDAPSGSSQPQTIELTVSTDEESNTTSLNQPVRDVPNASISGNPSSLDLVDSSTVDFSSTVTNEFNDPVSYNWTIDGNHQDSTSNFTHTFSSTGTYNVKLNLTDAKNLTSVSSLSYDVSNSSSGGNNNNNKKNGGGGGGGLSGNNYDYLFSFSDNLTSGEDESLSVKTQAFRTLNFTGEEEVVEPEIGVTVGNERPSEAATDPDGEIYAYIELDKENISTGDVSDVEIEFRADQSWMSTRNYTKENIRLLRYSSGWNTLDTSFSRTENGYNYFIADSPGLSVFAVTAREADLEVTDISVSKDNILAGEEFDIEVDIENKMSTSGWEVFNISAGSSNYTKNVSLDGNSETTIEFTETLTAGEHTITAGSETVEITVNEGSTGDDDQLQAQDTGSQSDETDESSEGNETDQSGEQDSSSSMMLPIIAGISAFIVIFGIAVGYYKRDEIEDFLDEKDIDLALPSKDEDEDTEKTVAEKFDELREEINNLGIDDKEVEVKMSHAKRMINQGEEAEAELVMGEITDRVLELTQEDEE